MTRASRIVTTLCLVLAAAVPACKSAGSSSESLPAAHRDPRIIALEEVNEAIGQNLQSVYDLVSLRHNDWMRPTTTITGVHTVVVYVDRMRMGGPEQLRTIALSTVESVLYLTASEAQAEFGLNNLGGAIWVRTRR